jgi:hypothetical protein
MGILEFGFREEERAERPPMMEFGSADVTTRGRFFTVRWPGESGSGGGAISKPSHPFLPLLKPRHAPEGVLA